VARAMVAVCVLAGLIAPPLATAEWLPAVDISAEDEFGFEQFPQVAVGASGDAVAVWPQLEGRYVIQASTMSAGGTWGPPVDISPPTLSGEDSLAPQVAMNAAGEAVAIWAYRGSNITIKGANRTPQGIWGAADGLSVPGGDLGFLDVAIDSAGRAVAIWTRMQTSTSDYVIEAADRSPGGQWGAPIQLSESGKNAWGPKLAVTPSGNVLAAWYRYNEDGYSIIQAAEKEPGGTWSKPENLSASGANAFSPEVAASVGRAVVVWERNDVVEAATKVAGGSWQGPVEVSGTKSREPSVGMDSNGNALAIWDFEPKVGFGEAETASLSVGQKTWTEPITLSKRLAGEGAAPKVAVDPAGKAMAIWTAWDGTARIVEAASGTVGGGWGSPVTVSPPGSWSHRAQIAVDSGGNAAAVWRAAEPRTTQAAVFDVTAPELSSVLIPSTVQAGRPISFAASPFDAWSPVNSVTWTFGDASTAMGSSVVHSFQDAGQFHVTVTATDATGYPTTKAATVNVTPALAIAGRVVPVRHGRARLTLNCPGTAICHGSATLTHGGRREGGSRPRSIGERGFAIPAGAQMTVAVKLRRKTLKLFAATHKKSLRARLTGDAVESRVVVLKQDLKKGA
jgi:PKD domain